MKTLDINDVILFHKKIVESSGGSVGIRDKGLIESALTRAYNSFDGIDLYPDIIDKISVITFSLINNHGFLDGNKRIGIAVMLLLLKLNDIKIEYSQIELINLGLIIAKSEYSESDIKKWLIEHIKC
jgi:death-on-curing protein